MWGTCDGCPDHEHSDQAIATKTLWQTLIENKIIMSRACQSTVELEGWCEGELVDDKLTGSRRPTDIPVFDVTTIKHLRATARRGMVSLTPINTGFADLFMNHECSLRRLGLSGALFQVMDPAISNLIYKINREYIANGINRRVVGHIDASHSQLPERTKYKHKPFLKMMELRFKVQAELLMMGFNVFLCDADTSFARDPLPYFSFSIDVEAQPDLTYITELETINENMPLNGGLYLTLSTFGGLRFLHLLQQEWMMGKRSRPTFDDQDAMFAAAKKYGCHRQYPSMGYSCLPDAAFTFEFLDPINFPTGHVFSTPKKFNDTLGRATPQRPFVIFHANGAGEEKENRMNQLGLWYYKHGELAHHDCSPASVAPSPTMFSPKSTPKERAPEL